MDTEDTVVNNLSVGDDNECLLQAFKDCVWSEQCDETIAMLCVDNVPEHTQGVVRMQIKKTDALQHEASQAFKRVENARAKAENHRSEADAEGLNCELTEKNVVEALAHASEQKRKAKVAERKAKEAQIKANTLRIKAKVAEELAREAQLIAEEERSKAVQAQKKALQVRHCAERQATKEALAIQSAELAEYDRIRHEDYAESIRYQASVEAINMELLKTQSEQSLS